MTYKIINLFGRSLPVTRCAKEIPQIVASHNTVRHLKDKTVLCVHLHENNIHHMVENTENGKYKNSHILVNSFTYLDMDALDKFEHIVSELHQKRVLKYELINILVHENYLDPFIMNVVSQSSKFHSQYAVHADYERKVDVISNMFISEKY